MLLGVIRQPLDSNFGATSPIWTCKTPRNGFPKKWAMRFSNARRRFLWWGLWTESNISMCCPPLKTKIPWKLLGSKMTFPFEIVTFQLTFVHFSRGGYCNYINHKHIKQQKRNSLTTCIVKSLGFGTKKHWVCFFGFQIWYPPWN